MLKLDPVESAYIETLALIGKGNPNNKSGNRSVSRHAFSQKLHHQF